MSTLRRVATANVANAEQFEEYNSCVDIWTRDGFKIEHHEQSAQYVTTVFVKREKSHVFSIFFILILVIGLVSYLTSVGEQKEVILYATALYLIGYSIAEVINVLRKTS